MRFRKYRARAIVLLLVLVSQFSIQCTEKGKPFSENRPAIKASPFEGTTIATDPELSAPAETTHLLQENLETLGTRVLSPQRLADPKSYVSRLVLDELMIFNRRLLAHPNPSDPQMISLLKRYETALWTDCQGFVDGCHGFNYFHRAPSSAQVVKLIAAQDPKNYFRLILVSMRLKSVDWDPEIPELLLKAPKANLSKEEQKFSLTIQSMLELALQTAAKKLTTQAAARQFLESINGWQLLAQPSWNLNSGTGSALFEMLATAGMLYDSNGHLQPDLKKLIAETDKDKRSNFARQEALKTRSGLNLAGVGVTFFNQDDELVFLMDSVITGKITAQGAALLFGSSHRSADELIQMTQGYLRILFLSTLTETTKVAKKIFNAAVPLKDLPFHALKESASITGLWNTFKAQALPLRNFAILAVNQRPNAKDLEKGINGLFDSIDSSIALSSSYPQELVLFHLLSQKNFTYDFENMLGNKVSYDSATLMRTLFEARVRPTFNFSESSEALNQYQLLYAFDMAVRSNLFPSVNINIDFFISDTLRLLSDKPMTQITNVIENVNKRLKQSTNYRVFKQACAEFRSGGLPQPRHIYINEVSSSPYFGSMIENAFRGIAPISTSTTTQDTTDNGGLFYSEQEYAEALESARLDLGNDIRLAEAMLTSYTSYLRNIGQSPMQIDGQTKLTRARIEQYRQARMALVTEAQKWQNDIGFCYWKALDRDFEVRDQILAAEIAYLKSVHAKIAQLRDPNLPETKRQTIKGSIQFANLPSGFKGQDQISADGYVYSSPDFLLRTRSYLRDGLRTQDSQIAPIAPNLTVDLGQSLNNDIDFIRSGMQTFIAYNPSVDEFVNAALRTLYRSKMPYVRWRASQSSAISDWGKTMKGVVSLNRLENEVLGHSETDAKTILTAHEDILRWTNISTTDRRLMSILVQREKFSPIMFGWRMAIPDEAGRRIQALWGIYDFPLKLMQEEELGYAWDNLEVVNAAVGKSDYNAPIRQTWSSASRDYFLVRAKSYRGPSVLPYNPVLDQKLDQSVISFVRSELKTIASFSESLQKHAQEVRLKPLSERPRFDLNIDTSYSEPLIDTNLFSNFKAKIERLEQSTSGCYQTDSTTKCAEFQP